MKKVLILIFAAVMITSCDEGKKEKEKVRYSQNSEDINTFKALISDYEKGNWDAMKKHYADTAQIFHNSSKGMKFAEVIDAHKQSLNGLESYQFDADENDYEMVVTDDGHTWVNFWGNWKGNVTGLDEEVDIPVHLTARFIDGKIVREYGYWDNAIMMMAMEGMDSTSVATDSIQ